MSKTVSAVTAANAGTKIQGIKVAYWSVTLLLAAALTLSGLGQLMKLGGNVDLVTNLGYPLYIMQILGVWKLLGVSRSGTAFPAAEGMDARRDLLLDDRRNILPPA